MASSKTYYALKMLSEENGGYNDPFYVVAETSEAITAYVEQPCTETRGNYLSMSGAMAAIPEEGEWGQSMRGRIVQIDDNSSLGQEVAGQLARSQTGLAHIGRGRPEQMQLFQALGKSYGNTDGSYCAARTRNSEEFVINMEPRPVRKNVFERPLAHGQRFKVRGVQVPAIA